MDPIEQFLQDSYKKYKNRLLTPEELTNIKSNGSYNNAKIFYSKPNIPVRLKVVEKIVEIPEKIVYVPYQSNGCNCGQMSCIICHG